MASVAADGGGCIAAALCLLGANLSWLRHAPRETGFEAAATLAIKQILPDSKDGIMIHRTRLLDPTPRLDFRSVGTAHRKEVVHAA